MKLLVQSWNTGELAYNAEEEETAPFHYRIDHIFNGSAECNIILQDPTGAISHKYNTPSSAVGGAVADDGGAETDETTEANEDTADDMTLAPAAPVVGDAYYFGFHRIFRKVRIDVSTPATTIGAGFGLTWEYSTGSDSWLSLAGVVDGTSNFFNAGANDVTWTVPSDWDTDEVGSISNLYWVRGRIGAFDSITQTAIGKQAWIEGIYIGPGKVTIEDPDATDLFYGRIMKAEANTESRTVALYCQDWLSQLDEVQITYDMREKLGTTDLRESTLRSDSTNLTPAENDAGTYYVYDDGEYNNAGGMAFVNDVYNGMSFVLTSGMTGTKTWITYPYKGVDTDADAYTDDWYETWTNDDNTDRAFADNDWTLVYTFAAELGHNTPSDFYVHDSISSATIHIKYMIAQTGAGNHVHLNIYDNNAAAYVEIDELQEVHHAKEATYTISEDLLPYIVDATGEINIEFDADRLGGSNDLTIWYCWIELTTETTGYSVPITINDTINPNKLEIATDLTAAATQVWEGIPYCVAKDIYLHIESATGPVLGGDSMVTLTCGAANVENTSGVSTRQYVGKTRLQMLKDLAIQDKAQFWITLGGVIVTWKSTFNNGAPETLTDGDINSWASTLDYSTLVNEVTAYGARIGDNRLSSTYTDATSEATYNQTRTRITNDAGLVSEQDTLARATALVNQYKDVQQILTATIAGNTATVGHDKTLVLGDEVSITSAYLGLSSAVYIVQRFNYDSTNHLTRLLLHPRVSQIGLQRDETGSFETVMQNSRRGTADGYVAAPESNEVA